MNISLFNCLVWRNLITIIKGITIMVIVTIFLIPVYITLAGNKASGKSNENELYNFTSCTTFWWTWVVEKTS